jgi:pimeloyl-ACP methyl ester carboxylesterase
VQPSRVTLGRIGVAFRRAGAGQPLVLLHGFTQDSRVWRPQLEALAQEADVIAWDAPGAGQSDDPPADYTIDDWADALAHFLEKLAIDRAAVGGLSWGGLLAQKLYERHPGRVASLVLADTYAGWTGSLSAVTAAGRLAACIADSGLASEDFVPRYLAGMFSASAPAGVREELATIMADTHPIGFRLMAVALAQADTRDLLATIKVPTLLVWGDADVRSPLRVAEQFRDAIAGSRLMVISGAGHVSNLERPAEFNAAVRQFLKPPAGSV